jgi:hypothetical protein
MLFAPRVKNEFKMKKSTGFIGWLPGKSSRVNFQSGGERFSFSRQVAPKSDEGGWGKGRDEGS